MLPGRPPPISLQLRETNNNNRALHLHMIKTSNCVHRTKETIYIKHFFVRPTCVKGDLILLNPEQSPILAKVALSYGMARSVRLAVFENQVDAMINQGSTLQEEALLRFREQLCKEADLGLLNTPDLTWARSDLQGNKEKRLNDNKEIYIIIVSSTLHSHLQSLRCRITYCCYA